MTGQPQWGMVHGRFQPFHNGHLAYLSAAAGRCRHLLVGITNPERLRTTPEREDPARHLPESNPWTYTERLLMIEAAAGAAAVGPVHVVPFPIADLDCWADYVPAGTVHYLRVLSPWGREKLARMRAAGHDVEVLDAPEGKTVSGQAVRAAMRAGGDWRALVPPAVAEVIRALPARGP